MDVQQINSNEMYHGDTIMASAYKLMAIAELMETPERALQLSQNTYSGIRIVLEETAKSLLIVLDQGNPDPVPVASCSPVCAGLISNN